MVMTDARIRTTHLAADPIPGRPEDYMKLPFHDTTLVIVHLGNFSFVIVALYMTAGVGNGGENAAKLAELASWLKLFRLPWLVMADWNMSPSQLRAGPWLAKVGGQVVLPNDGVITCTAGAAGSLLDYGVASADMIPWVRSFNVETVPWQPHAAIRFSLAAPLAPFLVRVQAKPITPPLDKLRKKDMPQQESDDDVDDHDTIERDQMKPMLNWSWKHCW